MYLEYVVGNVLDARFQYVQVWMICPDNRNFGNFHRSQKPSRDSVRGIQGVPSWDFKL